jgi:pimeloyl-[acyl-carrier protein] methyl ester esterase
MSTLILSGWTQSAEPLLALAPAAKVFDYSDFSSIERCFPGLAQFRETEHVIAWSMGGQLALRAIAMGALAPKHLTLIATPYRFVGEDGMGAETFRLFRESYAKDAARTKTRFHALVAKGDARQSEVVRRLQHHHEVENTSRWLPWLDALGLNDASAEPLERTPSTLIIHGENDQIVPLAQGEFLARTLPRAKLSRWADVGHAPHAHDVQRLRAEICAYHRVEEMA